MFAVGISALCLITFIIETTLLQFVEIGGIKPDLVLIVVIYSAFSFHKSKAISIGFLFGLIQDALSYGLFGLHAIVKCLSVFLIVALKENFISENPLVEYIISFIIVAGNSLLILLLTQRLFWVYRGSGLWERFSTLTGYTFLLLPLVFFLIDRIRFTLTSFLEKRGFKS